MSFYDALTVMLTRDGDIRVTTHRKPMGYRTEDLDKVRLLALYENIFRPAPRFKRERMINLCELAQHLVNSTRQQQPRKKRTRTGQ